MAPIITAENAIVDEVLYMFTEWRHGVDSSIVIAVNQDDPFVASGLLKKIETPELKLDALSYVVKRSVMDGRETILCALDLPGINDIVMPETGAGLLHIAGTGAVARILLMKGASHIMRDNELMTPLHMAVLNRKADVVDVLLEFGADVNASSATGLTPLHIAAKLEDINCVRKLRVMNTINVNARDSKMATPLHYAAMTGNVDCILSLLCTPMCDPNAVMYNGVTPLHMAVYSGHAAAVKQIMRMPGTNVNMQDVWKRTPMHIAVAALNPLTVLALVDGYADLNAQDVLGRTPLHIAVLVKSDTITNILADNKRVNPNIADINGMTPLHHAAVMGAAEAALRIVGMKGVNVNALDKNGDTPLALATRANNLGVAIVLQAGV